MFSRHRLRRINSKERYQRCKHDLQANPSKIEGADVLTHRYAGTVTHKTGEYICPPAAPEPGSELSRNEELGEQLMKLASELVAEKTGEKPLSYY